MTRTPPTTSRPGTRRRDDRGSAMILTMMALVLITGLASTVAVLTIDNLRSSWRAQQAGSAVNAADAGVAQAMTYLRSAGVRPLRCSPGCTGNSWGNKDAPTTVSLPGGAGESYRVWIEAVSPYPANDPGLYRIHSTGGAAGSASRTVLADVSVTTTEVPRGIFAHTISGGGSASVTRQSVFSTGCVWERDKIAMVPGQIDVAYGIPIGVHTSDYITTAHGSGQHCSETQGGLIHATGTGNNVTSAPCSTAYPYDQDRAGGSLIGTPCESVQTSYPKYYGPQNLDAGPEADVAGSFVKDDATLARLFNLKDPALSPTQLDQLRSVARAQGNYWTSSTVWSSPDEENAVMFFDLTKGSDLGGTVDLNKISDTAFGREANLADTDPRCTSRSLVIVVDGGNVKVNSNQRLFASLFLTSAAPYGQVVKANGTADFIGTIYADKVNLVGNFDASMDTCFLANTSPALLDFRAGSYREDDRGLS
ncbi:MULTISPECIES: hypothetical protein [unclassified Nocardioides]|uniref:pilus assembly PilX family protein n=1 Tax=unclassified Nocardioides TaxID=2615069 RepID=UPI0000571E0B|nr:MULTISPECIES: hypothetical protein [unclassified Nocardioides]ABL80641.1 hypothetical protein Noca_1125 [Nocardioides sp. JS614]